MIEPLTRRRPAVVAPSIGVPIAYVYADVLDEIRFNGRWQADRIAAGLLVGNHFRCPETDQSFVEIEGFIAGTHCEGLRDFARYLRLQWRSAGASLRYHFPDAEVVGWYVSWSGEAPEWGQDALVLHNTFFGHPWQVALRVPADAPDPGEPLAFRAGADGLEAGSVGLIRPAADSPSGAR